MKITVGKKSIIARNIKSVLCIIASSLVIYLYSMFYTHVVEKYNRTMLDVFSSNYSASVGDQVVFIFGLTISLFLLVVLIVNIIYLTIDIHYFKKSETNIDYNRIIKVTYGFPFNNAIKEIIVADISSITVNQSSVQRMFGCGSIHIDGYSNSNYSKTDFSVNIYGVDSVLDVKNKLIKQFG
jgi:uncharacterized membrane protein YdbT with pleckstrin-like domain